LKSNIQRVKYNEKSNKPDKCIWYSWDEICDNCGKEIRKFKEFMTTGIPDRAEKDYCLNCIRKYLDERDKYEH